MYELNKLSFKDSVESNRVSTLETTDILSLIKDGDFPIQLDSINMLASDLIKILREEYKEHGKSESYTKYKQLLPVVTFAGTFSQSFHQSNVKTLNGLMFCDIDNKAKDELIEIKTLLRSLPFVLSYWDSPSAQGLGFLISVDSLSTSNYSTIYKLVSQEYFDGILDPSCINFNRVTFISYDSNIYINPSLTPLDPASLLKRSPKGSSVISIDDIYSPNIHLNRLREEDPLGDLFQNPIEKYEIVKKKAQEREEAREIRKSNIKDYLLVDEIGEWLDHKCKFFTEKVLVVKFFNNSDLKNLKDGNNNNRAITFWAQGCNLLYLNPWMTKEEVFRELSIVNKSYINNPLSDTEILKQVDRVFATRRTRKDFGSHGVYRRALWDMFYNSSLRKRVNYPIEIKRSDLGKVKSAICYQKNKTKVLEAIKQLEKQELTLTTKLISDESSVYIKSVRKILEREEIKIKQSSDEKLNNAMIDLYERSELINFKNLKEKTGIARRFIIKFMSSKKEEIKIINQTIINNK